jgi:hypothetical protein
MAVKTDIHSLKEQLEKKKKKDIAGASFALSSQKPLKSLRFAFQFRDLESQLISLPPHTLQFVFKSLHPVNPSLATSPRRKCV